jgi:hypothetical protein
MRPHDWVKSTLGHGETMCRRCLITNREAAVLRLLDRCDVPNGPHDAGREMLPSEAGEPEETK